MSITAYCNESVVLLVKRDCIKTVDIRRFGTLLLISVALEGKVCISITILLRKIIVFDAASTLDGADCVPFTISKARNCSCRELQRRFSNFSRVPVLLAK